MEIIVEVPGEGKEIGSTKTIKPAFYSDGISLLPPGEYKAKQVEQFLDDDGDWYYSSTDQILPLNSRMVYIAEDLSEIDKKWALIEASNLIEPFEYNP